MKLPPLPSLDLLAIDPGERNTGVVWVSGGELAEARTLTYNDFLDFLWLDADFHSSADSWVIEEYHLYPWKLKQQEFKQVLTVRLIGATELMCRALKIPLAFQTAQVAKKFSTDDKLQRYGWMDRLSNVHERDAARHALYYLARCIGNG